MSAAFASAAHTVKERYVQQRLIPMAMEPRACAAIPEPFGGGITLYSATQIPHLLKIQAAITLGIPEHRIRVVAPAVGGGFGSKLNVYPEELLCTALGGSIEKLPFGHHGGNHPVRRLATNTVEITSQNHNYCVAEGSLSTADVSHVNLNDGTIEGIVCRDVPAFSVQYHPEAAAGPHDSAYLFDLLAENGVAHEYGRRESTASAWHDAISWSSSEGPTSSASCARSRRRRAAQCRAWC